MPPELSPTPDEFVVKARMGGRRIDAYLASRFSDFSRSVIQKIIDAEAVLVNGAPTKASYRVREGDVVSVRLPELSDTAFQAEDIPIPVVYEDDGFVIVDKPPNMVTHPARGHWSGTLVNALQFHFDELSSVAGENRPGIVHRLDRDTTGLLIVAKDDQSHRGLSIQFEARTIHKEYRAIVHGTPDRDRDYIDKPIGRHPTVREKMAVRHPGEGGKDAVTFYEVLERFQGYSYVRCLPQTGRTHQIRVHLLSIGHPIVADKAYTPRDRLSLGDLAPGIESAEEVLIERQALHAFSLELTHPTSNVAMTFEAPLPADMSRTLEALRTHRPLERETKRTRR
ncbi:MAG: RluA family pseudouridine synthase [Isosphaeraceae bacterium]|nr:RluA family pseudouridine synthase [Isosphaeraceae bacterium]